MRLTMPLLALVVALLLVASQAVYTVDQTKYAIRFQLGEIVDINDRALRETVIGLGGLLNPPEQGPIEWHLDSHG